VNLLDPNVSVNAQTCAVVVQVLQAGLRRAPRLVPANSANVSCDILANDRFGLFVLAIAGQQQKRTRQPFLGGSERLV
jgi:hypothetical protein